jgi:hypothetical protein
MKIIISSALLIGLSLNIAHAAEDKLTMCIFDPTGQNGYAYNYARDYTLQAPRFGLTNPIELKIYTNEDRVVDDFKSGRCDGAVMSSLRAKEFNSFTGSLDAIGAITNNKDLETALQVLSSKALAPKMSSGDFEVLGLIPVGAAYMMVDDRRIDTLSKAKGKNMAMLNFEKSVSRVAQKIAAKTVQVDLNTVANAFNTHKVDVLGAPAVVFLPFELAKGMTATDGTVQGGVVRFPILEITAAIVVHKNKLPNEGVNQKIREYIYSQLGTAFRFIDSAEKGIDSKYWINISPEDQQSSQALMRTIRIQMTQEGIYNKEMMHLLKNVRCKSNARNAECAVNDE